MLESRKFSCIYCDQPLEARAEQVDCVIECSGCGRSVIVPANTAASLWAPPVPVGPLNRVVPAIVAVVTGLIGGVATGAVTFAAFHMVSLAVIGVGLRETVIATLVATAVGGFACGLLGWNLSTR